MRNPPLATERRSMAVWLGETDERRRMQESAAPRRSCFWYSGRRMKHQVMLLVFLISTLFAGTARAADDFTVEIMASSTSWADRSFFGHAWICLGVNLSSGIKEDCYGFYPRSGGLGQIVGPGTVDSEFADKKPVTRFSHVEASVKNGISDAQRRQILTMIREWSTTKSFKLSDHNCVSFANEVAKAAGLHTPTLAAATTPVAFVKELKALNPGK